MTCEMRKAEEEGDLVDVLNAEQEEKSYANRKSSELAKARKAERRRQEAEANRARAAEVHRKTIAELASREYTNIDRALVNDAISKVLSMKPVEVNEEEADKVRDEIDGSKHLAQGYINLFTSCFQDGIENPDVGTIEVGERSARSVYSHTKVRSGLTLPTAAIFAKLDELLKKAKPYAVFPRWKGRSETSISLCSSFRLGASDFIAEFIVIRNTEGRNSLYAVKWTRKEEVEGGHHVAATMCQPGIFPLSTTVHSIPNSGGGVNRDITEKSIAQTDPPKLPSSNLLRQYIAANGLLGQYVAQ